MNDELSTLVQVINFYTRTLGALGHAIRLTAAGAHKGIDIARLKVMQHKMKLHYASTGTHDTMTLADLERLTGDNYAILNIPLENKYDLIHFYDALKKAKVSFAELPDLNLGDGYTQIAYDPQDREKLRGVTDSFKRILNEKPQDMSIEEYVRSGGDKGEELLNSLAVKGYQQQEAEELISNMKERNLDPNYTAIAINRQKMLIKETKDAYFFRLPEKNRGTSDRTYSGESYAIRVDKHDAVFIDDGKSVFTHIRENDAITLYTIDEKGQLYESLTHTERGYDVATRFSEVPHRTIEKVNKMTAEDTEMLPDFTRGQSSETSAREYREKMNSVHPVPDSLYKDVNEHSEFNRVVKGSGTAINEPTPEQKLANLAKYEDLKDKYLDSDHLVVDIDLDENLIVKGPSQYIVALPGDWGEDEIYCIGIDKNTSVLSDDGKYLRTFLHKDTDTTVSRLHSNGKPGRSFVLSGEDIAKCYGGVSDQVKIEGLEKTVKETVEKMSESIIKPHIHAR